MQNRRAEEHFTMQQKRVNSGLISKIETTTRSGTTSYRNNRILDFSCIAGFAHTQTKGEQK